MSTSQKKIIKKITNIEEDCSMCDEPEISAAENSIETHEKLFITEPELNIINKRSRPGQKWIMYVLYVLFLSFCADRGNLSRFRTDLVYTIGYPGQSFGFRLFRSVQDPLHVNR